jgi:anthranilate 1,2-dioxygenase small subunit
MSASEREIPRDWFRAIAVFDSAYCRCIDEDRLEKWPEFFVENCRYRITSADNFRQKLPIGLIAATSRKMLIDRVTALRRANIYEEQRYRHIVSQPTILEEHTDGASSETGFLVARVTPRTSPEVFATGSYRDRFTVVGGVLKLAERIVVCDSSRIDTLLALPL